MVNLFSSVLKPIVKMAMHLVGIVPQKVEIEPGTVINFWVPKNPTREKPSIVFLHGFFLDGIFTWVFQAVAFATSYNVYIPDLIFFGESTTDKPERSTAFQADCLAAGLKRLGVERCTVVGFSYGGMISFKLAKMFPELIESVVVTGCVEEYTESVNEKLLGDFGRSRLSELLLPETVAELKGLLSVGNEAKLFTSFPNFVYRHFLQVMYPWRKERAELLDQLVVPVNDATFTSTLYDQRIYLLWGENDQIFNVDVAKDIMLQLGDQGSLQLIKNAGHIALMDRPWCYNNNLKNIFDQLM